MRWRGAVPGENKNQPGLSSTAGDKTAPICWIYHPFVYNAPLTAAEVEISEDTAVLRAEAAEAYLAARPAAAAGAGTAAAAGGERPAVAGTPSAAAAAAGSPVGYVPSVGPGSRVAAAAAAPGAPAAATQRLTWQGPVPHLKWVNFYTRVITKLAGGATLRLMLQVAAESATGFGRGQIEEIRAALRELGLDDQIIIE